MAEDWKKGNFLKQCKRKKREKQSPRMTDEEFSLVLDID